MGAWGEFRETREFSGSSEPESDSLIQLGGLVEVDGRFYLKQSRHRLVTQRVFDLLIVILSVVVAVPAFLVIAALIKLDSPGPIFFKQERMGMHRQRFSMWKFRKMHEGLKSAGPMVTVRHDRRLTRVGAGLERTKLDELPQLFNVLNGTMSVVGPRPDVPKFIEYFPDSWDMVLSVNPGIFGASQNYFRNESELYPPSDVERFYLDNILPKMLELDSSYAQKPSLGRDIRLLIEGLFASIFGAITSRTLVMRRSQVASFLALTLMAIGAMTAALHATGNVMSSPEARRAVLLAVIVNPIVIVLLRIPKTVATSMTFTDLRRLLWSAVASTSVIAFGMWASHDLHALGSALALNLAFFLSFLFVYKLTVYSVYLTFFVHPTRVFAQRAILASMVIGPISAFVVLTAHYGLDAWIGVDRGKHIMTFLLALAVRPLVALHFRPEPLHTANSSRLRVEIGRQVLATIAGSSTILLGVILISRQTPASIDLLLDGATFLIFYTLFVIRKSLPSAGLVENPPVDASPVPPSTIIVIGSGIELLAYVASLDGIPEHNFRIAGVVTPETSRRLSTVGGHRVLGDTSDLAAILETTKVDQVVALEASLGDVPVGTLEAVANQFNCGYFPVRLFPGQTAAIATTDPAVAATAGGFAPVIYEIFPAEPNP